MADDVGSPAISTTAGAWPAQARDATRLQPALAGGCVVASIIALYLVSIDREWGKRGRGRRGRIPVEPPCTGTGSLGRGLAGQLAGRSFSELVRITIRS